MKKKLLLFIVAILCFLMGIAFAEDEMEITLPASIKIIGEEAFYGNTSIKKMIIPEGVTSIGSRAFANTALTEITLPKSLTEIAADAFEGCTDLCAYVSWDSYAKTWCFQNHIRYEATESPMSFKYTIENGEVTIDKYLGFAEKVFIPETIEGYPVTAIGAAFQSNYDLEWVRLPDSIKTIGKRAFSGCINLREIHFSKSLTTIGQSAFWSCPFEEVTLPPRVAHIGEWAFAYCNNLERINLHSAIVEIGDYALSGIPEVIATVNENSYAHAWCLEEGIAINVLPGFFTFATEGEKAVITAYNGNSTSVAIPGTYNGLPVEEIPSNVFSGNTILREIVIPDTIIRIAPGAFSGCTALEKVQMESGLNFIGEKSFAGCSMLKEIAIPDTVVSIGSYAFRGCSSMKRVVLSQQLFRIGDNSFADCSALTEIAIPDSIISIGREVFAGCERLSGVCATAGKKSATLVSRQGIPFIDSRNMELRFFQYADSNGILSLGIERYFGDERELILPESFAGIPITRVEEGAFDRCDGLKKIVFSEEMQTIAGRAFVNSGLENVWLSAGIVDIADDAFEGCMKLLIRAIDSSYGAQWCADSGIDYYLDTTPNDAEDFSVVILSATTCAINGYSGDRPDIVIPEKIDGRTVTGIVMHTFMDNLFITSVNIPGTVDTIGDYAFYDCENLSKVVLNDGIRVVGPFAFYGCGFEEIVFPNSVAIIHTGLKENDNLVRVVLPEQLTAIYDEMFFGLRNLKELRIPSTVKYIGGWAFVGTGLSHIILPDGLKTIGERAFYSKRNLEWVFIPSSVTSIGENAIHEDVKIYCYKGSYADQWAAKNGIATVYNF